MSNPRFVWLQVEPGKLILDGAGFAITYDGSQSMPWRMRHPHGSQHDLGHLNLESAKQTAEYKARELIEMGLIELESGHE